MEEPLFPGAIFRFAGTALRMKPDGMLISF